MSKAGFLPAVEQSDTSTHERKNPDCVVPRTSTPWEGNSSRQQFNAFVSLDEYILQLREF